jgi:carboxypeptidase Taq
MSYDKLVERVKKISNIGNAAGVLRWDQEVMMPEGGTPARSQQLATLSSVSHELLTEDETEKLLDEAEPSDESEEAVVREVRRGYKRADRVPNELVEEISTETSEAHPVWTRAKENDDFEEFAPTLERLVELRREYADYVNPDVPRYEALFEEYEPYLGLDTAERVLGTLREELVPLVDDVLGSEVSYESLEGIDVDEDTQERMVRDALDALGYDWKRGRLDVAPHPFSSGTQFDARVTTRFGDDPLDALTSTVHEFGHATYTLGLPDDEYGTPLGESRDLTVHESQSRLWENHVGRTLPFWEFFAPRFNEATGADVTPRRAYEAANSVEEHNPIRVEADELTYHSHILLRFEVERALIEGEIEVDEVPQVWNEKHEKYLGFRPDTDAEGALQDIHWSHGSFGYFPTYSLGSVLAAQLDAKVRDEIALDEKTREGEFDPLRDWLRENVHQHGKRYKTDELIERATGDELRASYFVDYAEEKYGELYGV